MIRHFQWGIIFVITLAFSANTALSQSWYNSAWQYRQGLTIDSDHADFSLSSDLSQFPLLIRLTDGSNGLFGKAQTDGDDILFTASDGTTKIPHEIEVYDDSGGSEELRAWVKVPAFSSSSDTVIYIYYGNASASSQQTPTGVWDSNFKGVWHMNNDPSGTAPQILDSTTNSNDGTSNGSMTSGDLVTGKIGECLDFDGSDDWISVPDDPSLDADLNSGFTLSFWYNKTSQVDPSWDGVIEKEEDANLWAYGFYTTYSAPNHQIRAAASDDGNPVEYTGSAHNLSLVTWYHVVLKYTGSNLIQYVNNSPSASGPDPLGIYNGTGVLQFARGSWAGNTEYGNCLLDEIRISSVVRSNDWVQASYVNQNNPQSYLNFQGEETAESGEGAVVIKNNILRPSRGESTVVSFRLDSPTKVTVTVYDLAGDQVDVLYNQTGSTGVNEVTWDGKNKRGKAVVPGVYYIVVKIDRQRYVHKALVVR